MKKLYEQRNQTGELVFVFPSNVEIHCHSEVLISQSDYFRGLFEFQTLSSQQSSTLIRQEVHEYSPKLFQTMVDFLYLSEIAINSNDLVDMLHLCQ